MKLLKYENYQVLPSEEIFLVKPFRDLYNKDKSENKEKFMQQLSICYFMIDPRSSYADIFDEGERLKKILSQEGLPKNFSISKDLKKAMEIYEELTTTTSQKLLESMRKAVKKIGDFLENVDLNAIDDKGRAKYNVSSIVQATDKIPALAKKLIETEKIVAAEIVENTRMRGGEEQAHAYEGGF